MPFISRGTSRGIMGALLGALTLWSCAQAPQSFTIERASDSKPAAEFKENGYTNYWTAIRHLALQEAREGWAEAEYRRFTRAIEMQMQGRTFSAQHLLRKLALDAKDEAVRRYALDLLARTLHDQGRWQDILNLPPGSPDEFAQAATIYNGSPPTEYRFGRLSPFLRIAHWPESTTPHLQVKLNGRKVRLMLDSGASRTMISSRVAAKCGITPLSEKSFWNLAASGKMFKTRLAVAGEIALDSLKIHHLPLAIVDDKQMQVKRFGRVQGRLQGVIGWDVIQNLELIMDGAEGSVILERPRIRKTAHRLHFWLGQPIVTLRSDSGQKLYFLLDTGSSHTLLYPPILHKLGIRDYRNSSHKFWSFGGRKRVKSQILPELTLWLGEHKMDFQNIRTVPLSMTFVRLDGVLGADLLKQGQVILDPLNGRFEYDPLSQ